MLSARLQKTIARTALALASLLSSLSCDSDSREDAGAETDASRPHSDEDTGMALHELGDGVVGSACAADADCGAGRCKLSESITGTRYPDGYCTGRCADDSECGHRGLCVAGFRGSAGSCYLRCDSDADCGRDGYRCRVSGDAGRCVPGPRPLSDGVVGDACAEDADCGGGPMSCAAKLSGVDAPGGYCSQTCAVSADCGAGGTCISGLTLVTVNIGVCYEACVPPAPCRDGYTCRSLSGTANDERGVCAPARADDDAGMP